MDHINQEYSNCWAHSIGGCGGGMTYEHIISKSMLKDGFAIKGKPWGQDNWLSPGKDGIKAKILCYNHNQLLSPCDAEMKRFGDFLEFCDQFTCYQEYYQLNSSNATGGFGHKSFFDMWGKEKFDGVLIEKWFLKTFFDFETILKSASVIKDKNKLLLALFEKKRFDSPFGLSFISTNKGFDPGSANKEIPFFIKDHFITSNADGGQDVNGFLAFYAGFQLLYLFPSAESFPSGLAELDLPKYPLFDKGKVSWHPNKVLKTTVVGSKGVNFEIGFSWD